MNLYPLPDELAKQVHLLTAGTYPVAGNKFNSENYERTYNMIAAFLVRQIRLLRRKVLRLAYAFNKAEYAYGEGEGRLIAAGGSEACHYISRDILRDRTYFNTEQAKKRTEAVDKFIHDLFPEENADPED